jgi:hypothetical protein
MRLDLSKSIDRTPADVFNFYAVNHVRNHPRWDPDMELVQVSEGPIGLGTVIRRRHTHYGELTEGTMKVVKYEHNRSFSVVINDGPIEIRGHMSIEPEADGGTCLTIGIEIPGSENPINPALIERTLNNIKALIETEVPQAS